VADTRERKEMVRSAQSAQQSGEKNAKEDTTISFHLRLSFVLLISEYGLFLFMTIPRPATTQAARAGRGSVTP
jgi:hypothetical protein